MTMISIDTMILNHTRPILFPQFQIYRQQQVFCPRIFPEQLYPGFAETNNLTT